MPYVITELCIRDGACAEVCPVTCIHSTPESKQFYIDPDICIECEQCVVVCPVEVQRPSRVFSQSASIFLIHPKVPPGATPAGGAGAYPGAARRRPSCQASILKMRLAFRPSALAR